MKKWIRAGVLLVVVVLMFQAGLFVYAANHINSENIEKINNEIQVKDEVRAAFETKYFNRAKRAEEIYQKFLIDYRVHDLYVQSIDQWILEGYELVDILSAYAFVYHHFGVIEDVLPMLVSRKQGVNWEDIYVQYKSAHPTFEPRTFDSELLERLRTNSGISTDDIVLADMISFLTNQDVEELIQSKLEGSTWTELSVHAGILYIAETLPRVPVRMDELEAYKGSTNLSEDQIILAFVLEHKLDAGLAIILELMNDGKSEEAIYAEILPEIFSLENVN